MSADAVEEFVDQAFPGSASGSLEESGIPAFLMALQWGDSTLPVGSFSFSNGLETAVQLGIVQNAVTLEAFVLTAVDQAATCDGIALLEAHRAMLAGDFDRIVAADQASFHRKINEEVRVMSTRMGKKLAEMSLYVSPDLPLLEKWLNLVKSGELPGMYAVVQGAVFAGMQLPEQLAFAVHQYGVASMMVGAALRMVKMNYLDGQKILLRVNKRAEAAYQLVRERTLSDMASYAPMMDIFAGIHVKSKVRMFMN